MKIIKKIIQSLWESFKIMSLIVTAFVSFFVVLYGAVCLCEYSFSAFIVAVIIAAFVGIAIYEFVEKNEKNDKSRT